MNLKTLGWCDHWNEFLSNESLMARIIAVHRSHFKGMTINGEINLQLSGKFQHGLVSESECPVVGDWARVSPPYIDQNNEPAALIEEVLPRRSVISRIGAGTAHVEQVLASNVDHAFIVTSANDDFSLNRIQRYVFLAKKGEVKPVVVLSKIDLNANYEELIKEIHSCLKEVGVIAVSVHNNIGVDQVRSFISSGSTSIFLGSSGVGKSSLTNSLLGLEIQKTKEIRVGDGKGRHATTSRELFLVSGGGMIIDTAGLREVQIFGEEESLDDTFKSIGEIALGCRFSNCTHTTEPSCAIRDAMESGQLAAGEYDNYLKMLREMEHANRKMDKRLASNQKKKWKAVTMNLRKRKKIEGR